MVADTVGLMQMGGCGCLLGPDPGLMEVPIGMYKIPEADMKTSILEGGGGE